MLHPLIPDRVSPYIQAGEFRVLDAFEQYLSTLRQQLIMLEVDFADVFVHLEVGFEEGTYRGFYEVFAQVERDEVYGVFEDLLGALGFYQVLCQFEMFQCFVLFQSYSYNLCPCYPDIIIL